MVRKLLILFLATTLLLSGVCVCSARAFLVNAFSPASNECPPHDDHDDHRDHAPGCPAASDGNVRLLVSRFSEQVNLLLDFALVGLLPETPDVPAAVVHVKPTPRALDTPLYITFCLLLI